jgi:hypothetical protein
VSCRYSKAVQAAVHLGPVQAAGDANSEDTQEEQAVQSEGDERQYLHLLSEEELGWVMGGSMQQLFPGAWEK